MLIADAILVYEGQGTAETMLALSAGVATLFDDVAVERAWQAETIRRLYSYDYTPPAEDESGEDEGY